MIATSENSHFVALFQPVTKGGLLDVSGHPIPEGSFGLDRLASPHFHAYVHTHYIDYIIYKH